MEGPGEEETGVGEEVGGCERWWGVGFLVGGGVDDWASGGR